MKTLQAHAALSRTFGSDLNFVFLGGGNTSFKTDELLYIKPSGTALAEIQAEDFIVMERAAMRRLFSEPLPEEVWEREAAVKDVMAAAVRPRGSGRPSVEAPLHEAIDYDYVYHMHPTMVNGMTCAVNGAAVCAELFPDALWVEYVDPGYTLAKVVGERLSEAAAGQGRQPQVIFLQNHGVFVGADSLDEIKTIYAQIMDTFAEAYAAAGVSTQLHIIPRNDESVCKHAPVLRNLLKSDDNRAIVAAAGYFTPAAGPLTPDHIVNAKSFAYFGEITAEGIAEFAENHGYLPKTVARDGEAVFCAANSLKEARATMVTTRDGALVGQLTTAFGGPRYLADSEREFIENWEVESYRKTIAADGLQNQRLANRVCVVTGAAQGFGLGIANGLAAAGGIVVLADMNLEGARKASEELNATYGKDRTLAVGVNIADEESVAAMVRDVAGECGGIDLLVANAGVLRAGSVKTLSKSDWDLVTNVNYTGYFLCVKHVAQLMAVQNAANTAGWTDIVQINSKSGLEGSNRNGAYAGTKFGTLGLTQSFAKELVEDRIKVNSVCPGNYLDGPLWTHPEKGLFVQYLRTGKVPGAQTIEDVKRSYESKVPMGRGCTPEDVVTAILYTVEQQYETGQAIPVTGGQVMLK